MNSKIRHNTRNLLAAISEGLLGYLMYLSRTGMQEAYSEYLLYDPIIRVAKDKEWIIESEFPVDNKKTQGDKLRIDFLFKSSKDTSKVIGLEVKYLKTDDQKLNFEKDYSKLESLNKFVEYSNLQGFILIAGRLSKNKAKEILVQNKKYILQQEIYYDSYFTSQFQKKYGVAIFKIISLEK